jgi:hypothetical protein
VQLALVDPELAIEKVQLLDAGGGLQTPEFFRD